MSTIPAATRLSASQKRVLSIYRQLTRIIHQKPVDVQTNMMNFVRQEFKKNMNIEKSKFFLIDYHIRRGQKYLDIIKVPTVTSMNTFKSF